MWADGSPEPSVTVLGPLDGTHTGEAANYLNLALTEAGEVVTIDLTHLTLLASSGVGLLFRTLEQARALGLELGIIAPNGTPAQHVLDLVQLPHQHTAHPRTADTGRP